MEDKKTLVIATGNPNKLKEIQSLLRDFPISVKSKDEAGLKSLEIEETGTTFEENALLKAKGIQAHTGTMVLADDSGITVDALQGAPGVYSARYAGEEGNDQRNNEKLLDALEGLPKEKRGAAFVCVIVLLFPDGKVLKARGVTRGYVGFEKRGQGGFGYDPIFVLPQGKTMGELTGKEKNEISHRGKALRKIKELLKEEF
ncbi:XTP/dITP diphosphatase [Isachenkonia alkalipeptolytica]|uniref:dITP/XTP pyrophosphatase n=1 Tax=Isachenkonia alkalipeptolytica TaxID=2565777 RepID=A0AA43XKB2_9CLOT|nr:XTP/dITP diphosphatase [Isachenkonia alkalipeptolytica]NBG87455.1 XTP/dITP diphosphatase [Isachenkonia alkalipeptolytica]